MIWQQADAASVDIVSLEHDTHDQDLADAINACLPTTFNLPDVRGRVAPQTERHPVAIAIDAIHAACRDPLRFIQPIS